MKKATSAFTLFIVGLCILSCNRSDVDKSSTTSETMAILKMDAANIEQIKVNNFISDGNFSNLNLIVDDDREL